MEKEAILQIQNSSNAKLFIEALNKASSEKPFAVLPNNFELRNLEELMPNSIRHRASFHTFSIEDYVTYCSKHNQKEDTTCCIDADLMEARTIFDFGSKENPLHGCHSASIQLKATAAYKAVLEIADKKQEQKEAAEFLEDWADLLTVHTSDGQEMTVATASHRLRDLTIDRARESNSKVEDFGSQMSEMEKIEARNKESIPSKITLTCNPFVGLGEYALEMRVNISTGGEVPKITFRLLRWEYLAEKIALDFQETLKEKLANEKCEFPIYLGSAKHGR